MMWTNLVSNSVGHLRMLGRSCLVTLFGLASFVSTVSHSATASRVADSALFDISQLPSIAASDLVLFGPVESLNRSRGTLQVLGQQVRMTQVARSVRVGSLVAVRGGIADDGSVVAQSLVAVSNAYVAGSTFVLLRGRVSSVNASVGTLRIGRLLVDYTSSLYSLEVTPVRNGSLVLLAGIQPQAGGVFLAQAKLSDVPNSIGGSDLSSIGGSDLSSIGGSDLSSIGGSDLQSIGGSDLQSIGGSDRKRSSIGGSDLRSIGGSDLRSIGGSDLQSIGGSDSR